MKLNRKELNWVIWWSEEYVSNGIGEENGDEKEVLKIIDKLKEWEESNLFERIVRRFRYKK